MVFDPARTAVAAIDAQAQRLLRFVQDAGQQCARRFAVGRCDIFQPQARVGIEAFRRTAIQRFHCFAGIDHLAVRYAQDPHNLICCQQAIGRRIGQVAVLPAARIAPPAVPEQQRACTEACLQQVQIGAMPFTDNTFHTQVVSIYARSQAGCVAGVYGADG
ncbi:hypothetical protein D3C81_1744820 [compost metagenome]